MLSVDIHPFSKAVKAITEIYTYIENELKEKNILKGYGASSGMIVKINQVGTLTGTIDAVKKARDEKMSICVSHRSIETEDTFICDLAVALNADYIKIGGPRRGDRITKYNRLLRLESEN